MELVIDANIVFSLLKKGSFTRQLSKKHSLELYTHPFVLDELDEHSGELCSSLGISEDTFERLKVILSKLVNVKKKPSPQQLNRAKSLISDFDDAPYLALAIKLGIDIWSNDSHFKEQSVARVFTTDELSAFLESRGG